MFFSMPHLQQQGASVYNGHLQGPITLTFGSRAVTTSPVLMTKSVCTGVRTPISHMRSECSTTKPHWWSVSV